MVYFSGFWFVLGVWWVVTANLTKWRSSGPVVFFYGPGLFANTSQFFIPRFLVTKANVFEFSCNSGGARGGALLLSGGRDKSLLKNGFRLEVFNRRLSLTSTHSSLRRCFRISFSWVLLLGLCLAITFSHFQFLLYSCCCRLSIYNPKSNEFCSHNNKSCFCQKLQKQRIQSLNLWMSFEDMSNFMSFYWYMTLFYCELCKTLDLKIIVRRWTIWDFLFSKDQVSF